MRERGVSQVISGLIAVRVAGRGSLKISRCRWVRVADFKFQDSDQATHHDFLNRTHTNKPAAAGIGHGQLTKLTNGTAVYMVNDSESICPSHFVR